MMLQPVVPSLPTQDIALSSGASPVREMPDAGDSPLTRFLAQLEAGQDSSIANVATRIDRLSVGRMSNVDMLRLQAALSDLSLRVQITTHVADGINRAVQTLTQRS
jgi:hypothetical protein